MSEFTIREATNADGAAVSRVVFAVLKEHGLEPDPAGIDSDLPDIEGNYSAGCGAFRVVELPDLGVVGCGGLYRVK